MKRLIKWFRPRLTWLDDNLIHISIIAFIVVTSLIPKIPIKFVEYTYIRIRIDDIFPAVLVGIFLLQLIRRKIKFNTKFLFLFVLFWASVFLSFLIGYYVLHTIPVFNIGLLHSLRRLQYMSVFFVIVSSTTSEEKFLHYMKIYFITLLLVSFYGIGQRFLQFPSIQSMNPAYVDGRLLILNPDDRINSTFGGHFDLAAYLSFSIPIMFGFYFFNYQKYFFGLYLLSLITLLYTAARSSFIAYVVSLSAFLLYLKKFKLWFLTLVITVGLLFVTGEMTKRFQQTFQVKTIYVNEQTGDINIEQQFGKTDQLPAGGFKIPLAQRKKLNIGEEELQKIAFERAFQEAKTQGRDTKNVQEIQKRANEISKYITPQRTVLCDIACSTRLQIEWPRAIAAFLYSPLVGTGPSSITEATDNDFLRWLGELGLLGAGLFMAILFVISKYIYLEAKKDKTNFRYIYFGFIFGLIALLINALYIDVFEASKIAYNFWTVAGLYIGLITLKNAKTN